MKIPSRSIALALLAGAAPAWAATALGEHVTVSGFGTLGVVRTNSDEGEYVREKQVTGATTSASMKVDSNLGLQATATVTPWLSATVQGLTTQRTSESFTSRIEWAYVKVTPLDGLAVRAGKFSLPNFLISDSRRIGYANTALRPANEVYGLDELDGGLKGLDASYQMHLSHAGSVTVTALGGSSVTSLGDLGNADTKNVRGLNVVWDNDGYALRIGQITARPQLPDAITASLPPGTALDETYKFTGVGFSMDQDDVVVQAEYVQRRSSQFESLIGANGWYVLGGYRFGKLLPYVQRSDLKATRDDHVFSAFGPQTTTALGLRWDAFASAAIKFQAERVDTHGTRGNSFVTPSVLTPFGPVPQPVTSPVTTLSVAVDFVF